MKLNLGNKTILDFDVVVDNADIYLALLNLSDEYIKIEGEMPEQTAMIMEYLSDPELKEALPTEKELNKLLKKYLKVAIYELENVEKSSEKLSIGGIDQKVTQLEFELTEENLGNMVIAVLEEMKDCKELKGHIQDIEKYLEEEMDYSGDLYDDFQDVLEDAIDGLEDQDFDDDDAMITLTDYVNGKHEIVGRKLEVQNMEIFEYATVRKGSEFAFEATFGPTIKIEGEGNDKKDILNAEYELYVEKNKVGTLKIADFDLKKWEKDQIKGKITLTPSKEFLSEVLGDSELYAIALVDPALEFSFDSTETTAKMSINLLSGKKVYLGITYDVKTKEGGKVSVPSNYVDQDDIDEWAESIDPEKLLEILEEAGIPSELLEGLTSSMMGSSGAMIENDVVGDYYF